MVVGRFEELESTLKTVDALAAAATAEAQSASTTAANAEREAKLAALGLMLLRGARLEARIAGVEASPATCTANTETLANTLQQVITFANSIETSVAHLQSGGISAGHVPVSTQGGVTQLVLDSHLAKVTASISGLRQLVEGGAAPQGSSILRQRAMLSCLPNPTYPPRPDTAFSWI